MFKIINLGNQESAIQVLTDIKNKQYSPFDVRITNSHITSLNLIIGKKVFRKDTLYVGSDTLWELMQPIGNKGKHNYHGLTPQNIFDALVTMKQSTEIELSYGNRYLIVTLATIFDDINLIVIVTPEGYLKNETKTIVNRIITIYPKKK